MGHCLVDLREVAELRKILVPLIFSVRLLDGATRLYTVSHHLLLLLDCHAVRLCRQPVGVFNLVLVPVTTARIRLNHHLSTTSHSTVAMLDSKLVAIGRRGSI